MEIRKQEFTCHQLHLREGNIDLEPGFQRGKVWGQKQKQKLLDTIFKGWPTPKLFLRMTDENKEIYQCIDGQQRLRTIFEFINDGFSLDEEFFPKGIAREKFSKLPPAIKEKFTTYSFDVDVVKDNNDDVIGDFYLRLNQGVVVNSSEKLKSIGGNMKEFVWDLSQNDFLRNKTSVKNTRDSFISICAQTCFLELNGVKNMKFKDLEKMFRDNRDFNNNSKKAKRIKKVYDELSLIFKKNTPEIKNRAAIISLYLLISALIDQKILTDNRSKIEKFFVNFQNKLDSKKEKDSELMTYQNAVIQAQDSKSSISKRNDILIKHLCEFDKVFSPYFPERKKVRIKINEKEPNEKNLIQPVIETMENINKKIEIFEQNNLRVSKIFSSPSEDIKSYNYLIQELNKWLEEMHTENLEKNVPEDQIKDEKGNKKKSIQILELYLQQKGQNPDNICKNLRTITLFAKSFVRHSGKDLDKKRDKTLADLGFDPLRVDFERLWEKSLIIFLEALQELEQKI